uniref:Uncharacterized protein n=1 Tax=Arundo donax TaxID=35708 RepID=A0A0A8Y1L1_ARUDO
MMKYSSIFIYQYIL